MLAALLGSRKAPTGYASLRRPGQRRTPQPHRNSTHSSVGPEPRWRTTTPKAPIANVLRSRLQASCYRTILVQIIPHAMSLCGKNGEKVSDNKGIFSGWWAVTDSNRRHPACKAGALPAELTALRKPIAPDDAVTQ